MKWLLAFGDIALILARILVVRKSWVNNKTKLYLAVIFNPLTIFGQGI